MRMDVKTAIRWAAELAALRFFPVGPEGLKAVAKKLAEFCSEENVPWLVKQVTDRYDEWPGPKTLRAIYSQKFRPLDGVEADHSGS